MAVIDVAPAIFLDKDGTLVRNVPYNVDPDQLCLLPDCVEGLQRLQEAGFRLVVVSNQSGVARGFFREAALRGVEAQLRGLLKQMGVTLGGFYYCPHHPEGLVTRYKIDCDCRKPKPGLLLRAASEMGIDLAASWLIGDILDDIEAGRRAGCRTVLLRNGNETEWRITPQRQPHVMARTIDQAADLILAETAGDRAGRRPLEPAVQRPVVLGAVSHSGVERRGAAAPLLENRPAPAATPEGQAT